MIERVAPARQSHAGLALAQEAKLVTWYVDPMLAPRLVDDIVQALDERFGLGALWLFGSEARDEARSDSDVDLAALFTREVSPVALHELRVELAARVGRDLDLVDLSRASPVLAMQVMRHGRLVADRDHRTRTRFLAALPSRYEDLRIVRAPIERRVRERLHG